MATQMIENVEHLAGLGEGQPAGVVELWSCWACTKFKHEGPGGCTEPGYSPVRPEDGCRHHESKPKPKAAAPGAGVEHGTAISCRRCPHGRAAGGKGMAGCQGDPLIETGTPCICHRPECQPAITPMASTHENCRACPHSPRDCGEAGVTVGEHDKGELCVCKIPGCHSTGAP